MARPKIHWCGGGRGLIAGGVACAIKAPYSRHFIERLYYHPELVTCKNCIAAMKKAGVWREHEEKV